MTRLEVIADWHARQSEPTDATVVISTEHLQAYAAALAWARKNGGKRLQAMLAKCDVA
jgi:hypothetical protein